MKLKVNSLVDKNGTGSPSLTYGATLPSGSVLDIQGNLNVVGIITAANFVGDGSGLTQLSISTKSKAIALKMILDPLPFKS